MIGTLKATSHAMLEQENHIARKVPLFVSDMKIMILNNSETETNQVVHFSLKIQDAENYTKIVITESITLE